MPDKINFSEVLTKLRKFYRDRKRPPTFEEIKKLFSYKFKNAAFELVDKLIKRGLLHKDKQGKI